jgi:hypothetical protein
VPDSSLTNWLGWRLVFFLVFLVFLFSFLHFLHLLRLRLQPRLRLRRRLQQTRRRRELDCGRRGRWLLLLLLLLRQRCQSGCGRGCWRCGRLCAVSRMRRRRRMWGSTAIRGRRRLDCGRGRRLGALRPVAWLFARRFGLCG